MFHALADGNRREILLRLGDGPASVSELAAPLNISLPAVVQHLQILEGSGLIASEKVGRVRTCKIENDAVQTVEAWIAARKTHLEQQFDKLGEYLADTSPQPEGTT
jgi:DNA-binding transcriptional ArsR family regulator